MKKAILCLALILCLMTSTACADVYSLFTFVIDVFGPKNITTCMDLFGDLHSFEQEEEVFSVGSVVCMLMDDNGTEDFSDDAMIRYTEGGKLTVDVMFDIIGDIACGKNWYNLINKSEELEGITFSDPSDYPIDNLYPLYTFVYGWDVKTKKTDLTDVEGNTFTFYQKEGVKICSGSVACLIMYDNGTEDKSDDTVLELWTNRFIPSVHIDKVYKKLIKKISRK